MAGPAAAGHARGQEILPLEAYQAADARAVAEAHRDDLAALLAEVGRCEAALDVHRHGLGFRRPRGVAGAGLHLTLWVWLPPDRPPGGRDVASRAAAVFAEHGRRLFRRLLARPAVEQDASVAGYAVVLTWFPPGQAGTPIGETLVVFAARGAVVRFARQGQPARAFLEGADLRLFDGQTEVRGPVPAVIDPPGEAPPAGC